MNKFVEIALEITKQWQKGAIICSPDTNVFWVKLKKTCESAVTYKDLAKTHSYFWFFYVTAYLCAFIQKPNHLIKV